MSYMKLGNTHIRENGHKVNVFKKVDEIKKDLKVVIPEIEGDKLLEKHFDKWFLIVPKEFVEKYSYLETGKGKVTTIKEALTKLREMLSKKEENMKKAK